MRKGLAAALVCGIGWLYADLGRGLGVQWAVSPDASYGAIVAIVALAILWRRRQFILNIQPSADSLAGAFVVAMGLLMYLAGLFAADLFTARASFVVVAGGLIWFLAGTSAAAAALTPLFFLVLAIPLPELVVRTLTSSLQTVAAQIAETTLTAGGIPVYRDGNVLELPASTLQVVEACSGLRSVISLASVGILLAWSTPGSTSRRLLLAVSTVPIAVVTNGFRVAATGAAAEAWGPAMTQDPWHSLAGWLTFVVSLAALWSVRRALFERLYQRHPWPEAVRT